MPQTETIITALSGLAGTITGGLLTFLVQRQQMKNGKQYSLSAFVIQPDYLAKALGVKTIYKRKDIFSFIPKDSR